MAADPGKRTKARDREARAVGTSASVCRLACEHGRGLSGNTACWPLLAARPGLLRALAQRATVGPSNWPQERRDSQKGRARHTAAAGHVVRQA
eukprot:14347984-Alexandrium_andersonii.AAC.1